MKSIIVPAPAKVNLFLNILGKRKDGYHNLLTLFERISLSDEIRISRIRKGIKVASDVRIAARPEDNIAYKAATAILAKARSKSGVSIKIKKRIPIAAGLGGGSSDAAAVLIGINKLLGLNIDNKALMRIGAKIGADVPFFIVNAPFAVGRSIGDRLHRMHFKMKLWHLLIYPGFKVATKDIYRAFDAAKAGSSKSLTPRRRSGSSTEPLPKCLTRLGGGAKMTFPNSWNGISGVMRNDLESVVIGKRPVIGKIIKCLASSLGARAMVSGSGPSVFCLYRTRGEAIKAKKKLLRSIAPALRRNWRVFIVETKM